MRTLVVAIQIVVLAWQIEMAAYAGIAASRRPRVFRPSPQPAAPKQPACPAGGTCPLQPSPQQPTPCRPIPAK